ncbi:hypothetical protein [Streptomyces sp. ISL-96]|nr:hypothetical protein [Streptomyces sp. ISL-96]
MERLHGHRRLLGNQQHGPVAGKYNVCTNAYYNRTGDVTDWKIHRA